MLLLQLRNRTDCVSKRDNLTGRRLVGGGADQPIRIRTVSNFGLWRETEKAGAPAKPWHEKTMESNINTFMALKSPAFFWEDWSVVNESHLITHFSSNVTDYNCFYFGIILFWILRNNVTYVPQHWLRIKFNFVSHLMLNIIWLQSNTE